MVLLLRPLVWLWHVPPRLAQLCLTALPLGLQARTRQTPLYRVLVVAASHYRLLPRRILEATGVSKLLSIASTGLRTAWAGATLALLACQGLLLAAFDRRRELGSVASPDTYSFAIPIGTPATSSKVRPNRDRMLRPTAYGSWWKQNRMGTAWYEEIYRARSAAHGEFRQWIVQMRAESERLESFLEVGCGRVVGYAELLKDHRYVGYDISEKEIEWCRSQRQHSQHDYVSGDFIQDGIGEKFDVVFSHAVIDHVYDVEAFLRAMVRASRGWVYATAYRGWFPQLKSHVYNWSPEHSCFYNDLAPTRLVRTLRRIGCSRVEVFALSAGKQEIPFETVIRARVEASRPKRWLNRASSLFS